MAKRKGGAPVAPRNISSAPVVGRPLRALGGVPGPMRQKLAPVPPVMPVVRRIPAIPPQAIGPLGPQEVTWPSYRLL
jgi:hypothetical protein